jgi:hypothetical protein
MSELFTFARLGFAHITDLRGADHILFLVALAAIYQWRDWRGAIAVVTGFTVGHSVTLALAALEIVAFPTALIEFLIPVTIVATALANLWPRAGVTSTRSILMRSAFATVFGLVHGAGFANYLRSLFVDDVALPLFGFNVGIEIGQIVVLLLAFAVFWLADGLVGRLRMVRGRFSPARLRTLSVSLAVSIIATGWAIERAPW